MIGLLCFSFVYRTSSLLECFMYLALEVYVNKFDVCFHNKFLSMRTKGILRTMGSHRRHTMLIIRVFLYGLIC